MSESPTDGRRVHHALQMQLEESASDAITEFHSLSGWDSKRNQAEVGLLNYAWKEKINKLKKKDDIPINNV